MVAVNYSAGYFKLLYVVFIVLSKKNIKAEDYLTPNYHFKIFNIFVCKSRVCVFLIRTGSTGTLWLNFIF